MNDWPPRITNREPRRRYVLFGGGHYQCYCGDLVSGNPDLNWERNPDRPPRDAVNVFQHGSNRKARISVDMELSIEVEATLAEWTERIHRYQQRTR